MPALCVALMTEVKVSTSDLPGRMPCEIVKTGFAVIVLFTVTTPDAAGAPLICDVSSVPYVKPAGRFSVMTSGAPFAPVPSFVIVSV